ncbi:M12 family metallo-peptidase [Nocardioides sp. LS1]|uniref:M12 family metallo-peptidase n=1 Tax=Nocardioides sp. LS1 TaxID=1027620 RepID=UPI000F621C64|nr:M12 family metallo-peptidase [Nocardioides sp. LS1]GCD88702.1 hypothetical protein NLS1_07080 [Nocardioides sp. LS1]
MVARAARFLVLALAVAFLPVALGAPAQAATRDAGSLFTPLPHLALTRDDRTRVAPRHYEAYRVDLAGVRSALAAAPGEGAVRRGAEPVTFSVPDPAGHLEKFAVQRVSVMQAGLAARHPQLRTYAGRGITDPLRTIRLDVTPMGFHASVRSVDGRASWYVDPATNERGTTTHLSYVGSAVPAPERFVERELAATAQQAAAGAPSLAGPNGAVTRKTFRLALLTDPTYAAYFGSANVLAEKVTLINRVDQVYNDDLAIRFVLIDGTDTKLNLDTAAKATGVNGPCGANACFTTADLTSCQGSTLSRNDWVLGQLVGADTFDVGHIGLGVNGGGVAGLGVVGGANKAEGCTGLPFPEGDFYAIDYVAHEMGHQMGGNHTFNGTQNNCSLTNRNGGTSVEPGSGSSVMAYAGICDQDDLQPHSDPYFSQRSIDEITATTDAAPGSENEVQTVTLAGFDTDGDSFQLTYPGHDPVTITRGGIGYTALQVSATINTLTGCRPTLTGYDSGSPQLSDKGFSATFNSGVGCRLTDLARMGVGTTTGGVTGFVGVQVNGGPDTNQGTQDATGNHAPAVVAPADKTIPAQTPFTLSGSATDSDPGTTLTYLWEQNDVGSLSPTGGTGLVDNTKADGPLFRVFGLRADVSTAQALTSPAPGENLATTSGSRTFPDMAQVLAGNTNAKTGTCPAAPADPKAKVPVAVVDCYSEFLPTADYGGLAGGTLHFRLTARDGFPTGGGVQHDDVALVVDSSAGPFLVTSRATPSAPATGGTTENVTWDVAGTQAASLAPNVRILLSADGGQSFPYELAASTPNDGSQAVTLPMVSTNRARIKIEAVGNYFFDVNDADFSITSPFALGSSIPDQSMQYADGPATTPTTSASSNNVDGDQLTATLSGVPGLTVTTTQTSADGVRPGTATYAIGGVADVAPGTYTATLSVKEGSAPDAAVATDAFTVTVTAEGATASYTGPAEAHTAVGDTTVQVPLSATIGQPADGSIGDITLASVTFKDRSTNKTLCVASVTGGGAGGSGTAACTATLTRTGPSTSYTVGTVVGGRFLRDNAADNSLVTVTSNDPSDHQAPSTTITSGPGPFVLGYQAAIGYASDEAGTFECSLDGDDVDCAGSGTTLRSLTPGTHVFEVAARDEAGNVDATPARRVFVAPYSVGQVNRVTDGWTRHHTRSAYRGGYLSTARSGQALTRHGESVTRIAVVVGTGPGYGRVAVLFKGQRLAVLDLASAQARGKVLMSVATLAHAASGQVRIVALDDKPVRIEGLGLLERQP